MDAIRWIFFLTLSILLISSCNNASAQFPHGVSGSAAPIAMLPVVAEPIQQI